MTEPSITCIACNRTSHNPADVTQRYCGNCHADAHGSIIWTRGEREHFDFITGSIGDAPVFKIFPARVPGRFTLTMAGIYAVVYGDYTRYDPVPQAFNSVEDAKYNASILLARFMRKMFFSQPSLGTSGGVPVTDELVEKLADQAEAGYDESQLVPRIRRVLEAFDAGEIDVEQVKSAVEQIKRDAGEAAAAQYYDTHDAVTGGLLAAPVHQEES